MSVFFFEQSMKSPASRRAMPLFAEPKTTTTSRTLSLARCQRQKQKNGHEQPSLKLSSEQHPVVELCIEFHALYYNTCLLRPVLQIVSRLYLLAIIAEDLHY